MVADSNQLQLNIINNFLKSVEIENPASDNFELALLGLSQLFNSSLIIYTSVYKDKNNNEYQFKNQFYNANEKNFVSKYPVITFLDNNIPTLIKKIYQAQHESVVEESQLMECFLPGHNPLKINKNKMVVIPFYFKKVMTGILSIRSDTKVNFKDKYLPLFNTIDTILRDRNRNINLQIKLKTYQSVLDLMPQRVFWKNRDSVYLGCNKAFSDDATLESPNEIIGITDFDIFPKQAELYRSDDANTMDTLEHLICSEEPQTHANGNTIWLRTSKRPIISDENKVVGLVGTYDDITQLKDIQHELIQAKKSLEKRVNERTKELFQSNEKLELAISDLKSTQNQLVESEKMASLGGLVAGIAHEINTPLGVAVTSASHLEHIANYLTEAVTTGNLKRSTFLEKCDELATSSDLILNNLEKASELVKNFKMIAVDQSHDEKRTIILHQYLDKVVYAMSPKLAKKNIRILLLGDEAFKVNIYAGAISQLVTNLIDNAFIHAFTTDTSGEIKIQFKTIDNYLELSVQDNGAGMSQETLKNVFEPFYTTKRGQGGTGLGLSVVYNLVTQKLNGTISCQSIIDDFTRFVILLPMKRK
jgi:two-component system autoinducer 2 sensor kinase/phosphatase LuxQ